ncbi:MAG: metallophosphoesterase [Clostridiaceae bacterium]
MHIYAIADLHLSHTSEKPMDVFGEAWRGHAEKIERNWRAVVSQDDLVLIPGDISWAMQLSAALPDLAFIGRLPGKKILLKGNHDYWWSAIGRVRAALPEGMRALQNDAFTEGGVGICGSRGWLCPGSVNFSAEDQKIYLRELDRLSLSLGAMQECEIRIAMMHFPPFCERERTSSGFTERLEQSGVNIVVYGHLHGEANKYAFEGEKNGVIYHCVAADKLEFMPKRIL